MAVSLGLYGKLKTKRKESKLVVYAGVHCTLNTVFSKAETSCDNAGLKDVGMSRLQLSQ